MRWTGRRFEFDSGSRSDESKLGRRSIDRVRGSESGARRRGGRQYVANEATARADDKIFRVEVHGDTSVRDLDPAKLLPYVDVRDAGVLRARFVSDDKFADIGDGEALRRCRAPDMLEGGLPSRGCRGLGVGGRCTDSE